MLLVSSDPCPCIRLYVRICVCTHTYTHNTITATNLFQSAAKSVSLSWGGYSIADLAIQGKAVAILDALTQIRIDNGWEDAALSAYGPLCEGTRALLDGKVASCVAIFQVLYTYMYVCMYVCMYACIQVLGDIPYTYMYVCMHVCMAGSTPVASSCNIHVCNLTPNGPASAVKEIIQVCMHAQNHINTYIHTYIHTDVVWDSAHAASLLWGATTKCYPF